MHTHGKTINKEHHLLDNQGGMGRCVLTMADDEGVRCKRKSKEKKKLIRGKQDQELIEE